MSPGPRSTKWWEANGWNFHFWWTLHLMHYIRSHPQIQLWNIKFSRRLKALGLKVHVVVVFVFDKILFFPYPSVWTLHGICDVCGGPSTRARVCLCFKSQVRCCYCDALRWAEETALSLRCWGLDGCQECGLKCVSARCSRVISTVHWAEHTVPARGHHYCRRVQERGGKCTWIWSTVGLQKQNPIPPLSPSFVCPPGFLSHILKLLSNRNKICTSHWSHSGFTVPP